MVVPARNEEALLGGTLEAILASVTRWQEASGAQAEVLVVDNDSSDRTREVAASYDGVTVLASSRRGAACARNDGARQARGRVLVFVDADTLIPPDAIGRVVELCERQGVGAGISPLAARDGGARAAAWWAYWGLMRRLPLARAKAMPAFLFCTREVFDGYGPFDEAVEIGEEWPILADLYRREPGRFRFEEGLTARTSSRRMELQRFGYARVFLRYTWAVLHASGRTGYGDNLRHRDGEVPR